MVGLAGMAVLLQLSLLPGLRPLDVVPNLMLVMVVLIALNVATSEALVMAAVCGLILDLAGSANFGLWTGLLVLVVLVVGIVGRAGFELDRVWVALGLVSAATIVMTLAVWSALAVRGGGFSMSLGWSGRLLAELVLNLILTITLQRLVRWALPRGGPGLESGG